MEIVELVVKEPPEKGDNYPHIKNLLLHKFQLSSVALRDRFESHQRRPGTLWSDLVFDLRSYLDNWLAGMKKRENEGKGEAICERKRQIICYYCNEIFHIKLSCPKLRKNSFETVANLNVNSENEDPFEKFKVKMEINDVDRVCLRDSGSSIDVCARIWIKESDLLGEYVWLKSPFDDVCNCLPLAKIKIKIKTKRTEIYTKAGIKPGGRRDNPYLLGNRMAELIDSREQGIQLINAVVTRNAGKVLLTKAGKEIFARGQVDPPPLKLISPSERKEEKEFVIPPFEGGKEIILAEI
ncbi:integrase catalytic domain-containing protein [Nephila pilipes]|uniref:Integrase catalytic domain-containing protein n=1 Tax=Nephila pilipes TaxID=299642 RepID=A0A8X6PKI3_NEPPI|nr:integrase catalytic domain-containing protein [Nephila pilipes]